MNRLAPRVPLVAALVGGVAVCLAAAWFMPPEWPAGVITIPLLVLALGASGLAVAAHRQAARIMEQQQRQLESAAGLRLQIIEALSLAIDARHRSTLSIRREQAYAAALARAFGLPECEVECIRTAALLHDVGKLAVPDHILTKPGPLTPDEQEKVRIHPDVGAGIIAGVEFPYPVASLVLCHHERWDGHGYPAGLAGDRIPLGARILACVDHFEALTSDRPFHQALSPAEALDVLRSEAGKALDPAAVAKFAEILPALSGAGEAAPAPPRVVPPAQTGAVPLPQRDAPAVMRDIAGANAEIQQLYDMSRAIGATLGVADAMTAAAARLQHVVPFGVCALFLHEPAEGLVRCRFASGPGAEWVRSLTVPLGAGVVGEAVAMRRAVINASPVTDAAIAGTLETAPPFESLLVSPLVVGDAAIGALALYHTDPHAFSDDHRRLAGLVAEQAAPVIANSVLFEQTQVDSVTDALTGLPNIRWLLVHLERELARASRLESPVALLLLDLDNLKDVNDTYGHSAGDQAIRKVATALVSGIRPYDLCVRYGGDEFIVVLSGCGPDEADAKRVELCQAVEAIVFEVQGRRRVRLGISCGAAVFPRDGRVYESLLAVADRRMYQDKGAHKSRDGRAAPAGPRSARVADVELDRAAAGVL